MGTDCRFAEESAQRNRISYKSREPLTDRRPCSQILSLTADRPVNANRAVYDGQCLNSPRDEPNNILATERAFPAGSDGL